jgi:hypothetical protein
MADAFGLSIAPEIDAAKPLSARIRIDPYRAGSTTELMRAWLPVTFAVNSINRSMGQPDLYPFVLGPRVLEKLEFVRGLVDRNRASVDRD